MKYALSYIIIMICLINNAYASKSDSRVTVFHENMENGSVSSIGMSSVDKGLYTGFSVNYIESSTVIQFNDRKTIYPVYVFMGLRAPWKLSPYFEVGADLAEIIIDDIFDRTDESEEHSVSQVDYYYSAGLDLAVTKRVSFSLYAKRYNFIFQNTFSPIIKVRPHSYGLGVKIRF